MKKRNIIIVIAVVLVLCVAACILVPGFVKPRSDTGDLFKYDEAHNNIDISENEKYELEQVMIVSRHNIRSPLSGGDSLLSQITPEEWFSWTSRSGELSVKGGQLEAAIGQFFRKYLENRKFIPENWQPDSDEVRFYSNSLQRTIATAKFFASGFLPVANVDVEYHMDYGTVDSVFCPVIRYNNPEFEKKVRSEIDEMCGPDGLAGVGKTLQESFELLEEVLDFKNSKYAKENNLTHIPLDDTKIEMTVGNEVKLTGGLALANSAVDALKLQIYEEEDLNKALFGHKLTAEEIQTICKIGDMYQEICEGTKTLAAQVMNPMLSEMKDELRSDGRKFSFLCGHDSTLTALVSALDIKEYELPEAISQKAPIGGKMVFEKYKGPSGEEFIKVYMCYNTADQLRKSTVTSLSTPPMFYALEFEGLDQNEDGYYTYDDVMAKIDEAISHYYDYYDEEISDAA